MQVVRSTNPALKGKKFRRMVLTFDAQGNDAKVAVDHELWSRRGNHPNWYPDGKYLVMNLSPEDDVMRFCKFRYDGSDFTVLSEKRLGSGHPSVDGTDQYLLTDAYEGEKRGLPGIDSCPRHEVPIRLVDLLGDEEVRVCTIYTLGIKGPFRLDLNPLWSRDYRLVCFNEAPEGTRAVLIADLSKSLNR